MASAMVASAATGAALELLFGNFLKAICHLKKQNSNFKPSLERLENMLNSMVPNIEKIEAFNRDFDRPKEIEGLKVLITEGEELVRKCLKIHRYNVLEISRHTKKIAILEKNIRYYILTVVQIQQSADQKETLVEVKVTTAVLKEHSVGLRRLSEQISRLNFSSAVSGASSSLVGVCSPPELKVKPVGLEIPLRDLKIKLLKDDLASLIVLSAPGGCGKTTLATALCQDVDVQEKFRGNIFFVTVSKQPKLLVIVERLFLHKNYELPVIQTEEDAVNQLEHMLRQIGPDPILFVLDDVWSGSESLLEKLKFGIENFKILVTSRSEFPRFSATYKLQTLKFTDAMTLFQQSAFLKDGCSYIPDTDIVTKIVEGCKGLPLAISVIGKSLCGKHAAEWRKRLKECSKAASILSDSELLNCLQVSVDALNDKVEVKECYMDLGSFPEGQRIPATTLIDMWVELHNLDEDDAVINLYELSNRNLVELVVIRKDAAEDDGSYNEHFVKQHDLLRELAILQSNSESIECRKRLFVHINGNSFPEWWMEQRQLVISAKLLSISTDETFLSRWESIQAAEVEVLVLNFLTKNYTLPEFMERMYKLKVLIVTNYGFFPAALSNSPILGNLSYLKRIRLEKVSLPSFFLGSIRLMQLKKISLVMCYIGEAFSNFSNIAAAFPYLEEINIDYCNDLAELPPGCCDLVHLKKLGITNCHQLSMLPEEIGNLVNLEELRLNSCIELLMLPETVGSLYKMKILDVSDCLSITKLPEQIGNLGNLRKLYMIECSSCQLPPSITNLVDLKEVICDEETANLWRAFKPFLPSLTIKEHKEFNLNWLDNSCFL